MTQPINILAGLISLNKQKLTPSQRNRCLALFALQNNPFGMMSQWLYSQSLQRENTNAKIIDSKNDSLKEFEEILSELKINIHDKDDHILRRNETIQLQQNTIDQINRNEEDLFNRLQGQQEFMQRLSLGKEVLLELIASQLNVIDNINENKEDLSREIEFKEKEIQALNESLDQVLMELRLGLSDQTENSNLVKSLNNLTNLNELLFQSLNEAMIEIQRLAGLNN